MSPHSEPRAERERSTITYRVLEGTARPERLDVQLRHFRARLPSHHRCCPSQPACRLHQLSHSPPKTPLPTGSQSSDQVYVSTRDGAVYHSPFPVDGKPDGTAAATDSVEPRAMAPRTRRESIVSNASGRTRQRASCCPAPPIYACRPSPTRAAARRPGRGNRRRPSREAFKLRRKPAPRRLRPPHRAHRRTTAGHMTALLMLCRGHLAAPRRSQPGRTLCSCARGRR